MLNSEDWTLVSNDGTNVVAVNGPETFTGTLVAFEVMRKKGASLLSDVLYGPYGPVSWLDKNIPYTATYQNGLLYQVTGNGVVKTFDWSFGKVINISIRAE
jgi:hypothetical protein